MTVGVGDWLTLRPIGKTDATLPPLSIDGENDESIDVRFDGASLDATSIDVLRRDLRFAPSTHSPRAATALNSSRNLPLTHNGALVTCVIRRTDQVDPGSSNAASWPVRRVRRRDAPVRRSPVAGSMFAYEASLSLV
ncbi:hypothetical protein [Burkholderia stagnalis]|uniref:hypothetical protein n=1 Tax=Burkholderia stagnalis TaxID=1503054 RepID=UPI000F55B2BF|nr:hypothetical protein [Burkholderia stagnalis]RQQ42472.1 hypothetical protein DF145_32250 [Burkholderia stagnalis]RQY08135.1 hypothetical protein DF115_32100 [Burkholderia stagnalis]RQY23687.1 hypothetical protein DF114_32120 [Burkholderia stagnalis]